MKWRRWLFFSILISVLLLGFVWLTQTQAGLNTAVVIAEKLTPGQLKIQNARGTLLGDLHADFASYDNRHVGLTFKNVHIQWQPWGLIKSHIDLRTVNIDKVTIFIKKKTTPPKRPFVAEDLKIPFILSINDGHVKEITYEHGRAFIAAEVLKLDTRWSRRGFDITELRLKNNWWNGFIHGYISARSLISNDLQGEWDRENWKGHVSAVGRWQNFILTADLLEPSAIHFQADMKNLLTKLEWKSNLTAAFTEIPTQTQPLKLSMEHGGTLNEWKGTAKLETENHATTGFATMTGHRDDLTFNNIELQQINKGKLKGSGALMAFTEHPQLDLKLLWENLRWPVKDSTVLIPKGLFEFKGDHRNFTAKLSSAFDINKKFHLKGTLNLNGNINDIKLSESELRVNNKAIILNGEMNPNNTDWKFNWKSEPLAIPATPYSHTIQTTLNGTADGNFSEDRYHVNIPKLAGRWGQLPFSGEFNAERENGNLKIDNTIQIGKNSAKIQAQQKDSLTADISLAISQLDQVMPKIHGDLRSNIHLKNKEWDAELNSKNIQFENQEAANINLTLKGSEQSHTLAAQFTALKSRVHFMAKGGLKDHKWNGKITDISILGAIKTAWQLENATAITFDQESISMPEHLCLRQNTNQFCSKWNHNNKEHEILFTAKAVPMNILKMLPALQETEWQGTFDMNAKYNTREKNTLASADLTIHPGQLNKQAYKGGTAHVSIDQKLFANAELEAWPGSHAKIRVEMPSFNHSSTKDLMKQAINGEINIDATNIPNNHHIEGKVQGKISIAGQLGDPKFSGKMQLLNGQADLPNAGIRLTDLILNISANDEKNFNIDGSAKSGNGIVYAKGLAQFKNHDFSTQVKITGNRFKVIDLAEAQVFASPDLNLIYQNKNLNLNGTVNIDEAKITPRDLPDYHGPSKDVKIIGVQEKAESPLQMTSDVKLVLGNKVEFNGFNLTGNIKGQIRLLQQPGRKTRANGELNVEKGQYTIYGQTLNIARGRLLFAGGQIDNPGLDVRAERNIKVVTTPTSQFQLLNQNTGTTEEKEFRDGVVGISLRGTLLQPDVSFYSNPPLTEADQLSYLVVGVPSNNVSAAQSTLLTGAVGELADKMGFNERNRLFRQLAGIGHLDQVALESRSRYDAEKGMASTQTSLVLGKSLSPKLFISYSIGLLDPVSVVQVRYKISERWSLQTDTSNLGQGGGDLIYNIEKD